ncbi:EamA family transporter RarD [Denitrificimonas caeni]|uniref:EamA family transporter RarD n=1 Tax=Denitrificimonas caeni TaxID=521720 RepID=A0AAF0AKL3_9GAMM|nr:EamA family transporter RarD [Denitrificimonas caeni]NLJ11463.1 EamA family transporter RarD [Gammaproteobacteria bacterium]WBE25586.1 EamA family transporter RarD [Denitrificimonas caeni]
MNFTPNPRRGYVLGLLAYSIWGLFPLYFKTLDGTPAQEVIVHRVLWSALFSSGLLLIWRHRGWWLELYHHPKRFIFLAASGALIATNWLIYVWAVHHDRMVEASLGYYINPLVNVLLAMLFLRERLRRLQWLAIALAAVGVGLQVWSLGKVPWISLALACSFGFYGLIRKQAPVAALPGLTVETWLLVPVALTWLWISPQASSMQSEFWGSSEMFWLAAAGPVTLLPLLCFNEAAKNLPYASLAFLQYITPTVLLLLAVLVFKEPFAAQSFIFFGFIWAALAVYSWDAVRVLRGRGNALPEK